MQGTGESSANMLHLSLEIDISININQVSEGKSLFWTIVKLAMANETLLSYSCFGDGQGISILTAVLKKLHSSK